MDDETRAYLDALEASLMARMNDNQERLLERIRLNETAIEALTTAMGGLTAALADLVEIARGTKNTSASMTALLTNLDRRMTDLEKR